MSNVVILFQRFRYIKLLLDYVLIAIQKAGLFLQEFRILFFKIIQLFINKDTAFWRFFLHCWLNERVMNLARQHWWRVRKQNEKFVKSNLELLRLMEHFFSRSSICNFFWLLCKNLQMFWNWGSTVHWWNSLRLLFIYMNDESLNLMTVEGALIE